MAYNGSGTFNRLYSWETEAASGEFISSTKMDADTDDIATGMSLALLKDGQQTPTANIPFGGFKITNLGDATLDTDALNRQAADARFQPLDADLTAIAGLTSAADKVPYFTGSGTAAVADFTAYGRSVVAVADEAAFKALVNLEIGTDVQAYDADLSALAGVTSAADRLPYFTGAGTADVATFTSAARDLLDDATAGDMLTTLGVSAFVQTILNDADAAAVRTTIDAQQLDTELTALAGLTSAADSLPYFTGSGTAALTTITSAGRTFLAYSSAAAQFTGIKQAATEDATGVAELATTAEVVTGTDTARIVTPAGSRLAIRTEVWGTEASAVFDAMTSAGLFKRRMRAIADLISYLKYYDIWDQLDALWLTLAYDATSAQVNWVSPGTYNLSVSGTPTFTRDAGYTGDGSAAYLNTNFLPDGTDHYLQDNASVGVWVPANTTSGRAVVGNVNGSSRMKIALDVTGSLQSRMNDNTNQTTADSSKTGVFALDRSASANYIKYKDGVAIETETQASTGLSAGNISLLADPINSSFSDATIYAAWAGGSLTASQHSSMNGVLRAYSNVFINKTI